MTDGARNLLVNLTGALAVGLLVGYVMSARTGGPPFRELFPANFLRAFAPYAFAALLALRFTPRVGGRRVADYVFIPLVGSSLSLPFFYHSLVGFALPRAEAVPAAILILSLFFAAYVVFGLVALLALRSVVLIVGGSSYR